MVWRVPAWLSGLVVAVVAHGRPDALFVEVGDVHSAYDRMPQMVAAVDRLRDANPAVPLVILVDGDVFEGGNAIAQRTHGALEFAWLEALTRRAPTVLTLGNHEPDVVPLAELLPRLHAAGVHVLSANVCDRATSRPWAPASIDLPLGPHRVTIVGFTTDALNTFPAAARPTLAIAGPVAWASAHLAALLAGADDRILLSHAGLRDDRDILPAVPAGTLYVGAHDHLRLVHAEGRTIYLQSGSWLECLTVARLNHTSRGAQWDVEQLALEERSPLDAALATRIHETLARELTPAERAIVGHLDRALSPADAARFATEAARQAAGADVAFIGGTTFGGGLPQGPVTRYAFDGCVRFDGPLCVGETTGATLRQMLARANVGEDAPFATRTGENLVAAGLNAAQLVPDRRYRIVTTDWIARNPERYLGPDAPPLHLLPNLRLKAAVLAALHEASQ